MIKILFLAANPLNTPELRLKEEADTIAGALRAAKYGGHFEFITEYAVRVDQLQELLLKHRPHVVHFSGHGSGDGEILLEDESGGPHPVTPAALSRTFKLCREDLRLVVINACFSQPQAEAIARYVPAVVGMAAQVADPAAIAFVVAFYRALAYGEDVRKAFDLGRNELEHECPGAAGVPQLVPGRADPARVVFATEKPPPELVQPGATLTPVHLEYLRGLFGQPWAQVRLADMLADRDDEVNLLDVYVPLRVDFEIVVKTEAHCIVDWWVKREKEDGLRDRALEHALAMQGSEAELVELVPKLRTWSSLKVDEAGLQKIVAGIQTKITKRRAEGQETKDDNHIWFMEAHDAASVQPRFVLLGGPGSGKSSFLRHLALCMAGDLRRRAGDEKVPDNANLGKALNDDWLLKDPCTPVFIELRDLVRKVFPPLPLNPEREAEAPSCDHLWKYVREQVLAGDLVPFGLELRGFFSRGEAILLLDGLDEVPDADDRGRRRQSQLKRFIASLVTAYPKLRIILTGRPHAYQPDDWELRGFGRAELTTLSHDRLHELATALFAAVQLPEAAQRAEAFSQVIRKAVQAGKVKPSMHATPLFFTMLAALWLRDPERGLPDTEAELYSQSVELLLGRWTRRRTAEPSVTDDLGLTEAELRYVLENLACTIHERSQPNEDTTVFHPKELVGILMDGGYDVKIRAVPDYLEQRVGLLASQKVNQVHFLHRSFQEYLAACELICRDPDKRRPPVDPARRFPAGLVTRACQAPDLWENVVLLAGDILASERDDDLWKLLAGLCRPYLRNQGEAKAALSALKIADRRALLAQCCDEFDPRTPVLGALQRTAERVLADVAALSPAQRDIAGKLLGSDPFPGHDTREGVGIKNGLPDIAWVKIAKADSATEQQEFAYQKDERPTEPDFWIARYPITYAQYHAFLEADDGYDLDRWWQEPEALAVPEGHRTKVDRQRFKFWNHPAENVSWYDAIAFCRWLTEKVKVKVEVQAEGWEKLVPPELAQSQAWKITLPTEWQWEKAARGHDGRQFPWGKEYVSGYANIDETSGSSKVGPHYLQKTSAVGMYSQGASPYDVMDLSGNVWEWCLNEYETPERIQEEGDANRVRRGGSWSGYGDVASARARSVNWSRARHVNYGFRLVAVSSSP